MGGLVYITENSRVYDAQKPQDVSSILGIEVVHRALDFPEIERNNLVQFASDRVKNAYDQVGQPCFLEESSVEIPDAFFYLGGNADPTKLKETLSSLDGRSGLASVVVAYTEDGNDVQIFQGDIPGKVIASSGTSPTWWDVHWQPSGYQFSNHELRGLPHIFDKRTMQYLRLAEHLDLPQARDVYEAHVTVKCEGLEDWQRFSAVCHDLGIKGIQIQLPQGDYPTHLITGSWHKGSFPRVRDEVYGIGSLLKERGFQPIRHKVEGMLRNEQVPLTDEDSQARGNEQYFEFHVKVRRVANGDNLAEICQNHGAHLSRSASTRLGSTEQRFVTLRSKLGLEGALAQFDSLIGDLEEAGFSLSNKLKEYTVYDDNPEQDRGWAAV